MKKLYIKTIIVWVLCIIPIVSIAGGVVFFLLLYFFLKDKKYKKAILFTFLSPVFIVPLFFFFKGTSDYFSGTAVLISGGDPSIMGGNLNREYRVRHDFTTGIAFAGIRFFLDKTNNIAVKALTKKFGYQKGAYSGIYPDYITSLKEIESSKEFAELTIKDDLINIEFENEELTISLKNQNYHIVYSLPSEYVNNKTPIAILNNECLLFRIEEEKIYLVDIKGKELIALYYSSFLLNRTYIL